jgi:hypothetical protein
LSYDRRAAGQPKRKRRSRYPGRPVILEKRVAKMHAELLEGRMAHLRKPFQYATDPLLCVL